MFSGWFRKRRRRRIRSTPFPEDWNNILSRNVFHVSQLSRPQQARLRQLVQVFVAEKNWEGCGGLKMTDEVRITIAAQACLLVVGLPGNTWFDHILSILVYPQGYVAADRRTGPGGVVLEGKQARLGEAWYGGPVVLSWDDALAGGRRETPGSNLVLHEFAHQLDMLNGRVADGTPPLDSAEQLERWLSILGPEYDQLVQRCQHHHHGFIDCYGAESPAEFFAVLTEAFFERPGPIRLHHSDIYDVLQEFYQLDPADWPDHR